MQKVMARFRELKIDKERIQTSSFTVTPQYKHQPPYSSEPTPSPPEILGFTVSNTITVEVRDLEKVVTVIEAALGAGANHFRGLQWIVRGEQQARLSALKIAAAKAREKAVVLSEALKVKLVRLMTVNEGGSVYRVLRVGQRITHNPKVKGSNPFPATTFYLSGCSYTLVQGNSPSPQRLKSIDS